MLGQAGEDGGVVIAFRAEKGDFSGVGLPVVEGLKGGGQCAAARDHDAVGVAPFDLFGVGVDEGDGDAGGAEGVADGAADAASAEDCNRVHAGSNLLPGCSSLGE